MLQIIYVGVKLCDRLRAEDARDRLLGQSAALRVSRIRCPNVFIFSVLAAFSPDEKASTSNLSLPRFPFVRPDPVQFFGIIEAFLGRFGVTSIVRKISKSP